MRCALDRFKVLYHGELTDTKGSESKQTHANPITVSFHRPITASCNHQVGWPFFLGFLCDNSAVVGDLLVAVGDQSALQGRRDTSSKGDSKCNLQDVNLRVVRPNVDVHCSEMSLCAAVHRYSGI